MYTTFIAIIEKNNHGRQNTVLVWTALIGGKSYITSSLTEGNILSLSACPPSTGQGYPQTGEWVGYPPDPSDKLRTGGMPLAVYIGTFLFPIFFWIFLKQYIRNKVHSLSLTKPLFTSWPIIFNSILLYWFNLTSLPKCSWFICVHLQNNTEKKKNCRLHILLFFKSSSSLH